MTLQKPCLLTHLATFPGDIATKAAALAEVYALKVKVEGNFMLLDYNMIDSPRKHPYVDQCRGVVIWVCPETSRLEYARRPLDRFYNLGEYPEGEAEFDWATATVEEKADGSLICVWANRETYRWEIGTRGNAFGNNTITTLSGEDSTITFRSLFLRAFGGEERFEEAFGRYGLPWLTYMFELCCLENKIVTAYEGDQVYLLAARDHVSGRDLSPGMLDQLAQRLSVKRPERYKLRSFEEASEAVNKLENLREGFVLRDIESRRIKVKSLAYVQAHHLRGEGVTPKRAVLLALAGEVEEFCSYFPEFGPLLEPYQQAVDETTDAILAAFDHLRGIEDQKAFALEALKHHFSALLFTMRKGVSLEDAIAKLTENSKMHVFGPQALKVAQ